MSELMEIICVKTGCGYISDLKYFRNREVLVRVIKELPLERWSVEEWMDAVCYLTDETCLLHSQAAAKSCLLHKLKSGMS